MRTTFSIGFICRPSKANKSGYSPVEMSINLNGSRVFITLPRREIPTVFQRDMTSKRVNDLKKYTANVYSRVQEKMNDMLVRDIPITAEAIKYYIQHGFSDTYTIGEMFDDFLVFKRSQWNSDEITYSVYKKFELVRDSFLSFFSKDTDISKVNSTDISAYYTHIKGKMELSTCSGYMTRLKGAFLYAVRSGRLRVVPFMGIKVVKKEKDIEFLSEDEVRLIAEKDFGIDRLNRVRDLFVFLCYTGLSYCDMKGLNREDIKESEYGRYIEKKRQKTGVLFTVFLFPEAIGILDRYDWNLPVLSNQKMNGYLHEIGDICGIRKPLHCHICRHTFATLMLNKGLPINIVQRTLGHTNIRQTSHYAKLLSKSVIDCMSKMK